MVEKNVSSWACYTCFFQFIMALLGASPAIFLMVIPWLVVVIPCYFDYATFTNSCYIVVLFLSLLPYSYYRVFFISHFSFYSLVSISWRFIECLLYSHASLIYSHFSSVLTCFVVKNHFFSHPRLSAVLCHLISYVFVISTHR